MKLYFYFFFIFFTFLFLFYPGESEYIKLFAYNRRLFAQEKSVSHFIEARVPYVKTNTVPSLTAEGIYIVDLPSFTPVLEKNIHGRFLPASTAKMITALVSLDIYKPEDIITVKRVLEDGQVMGLIQGEKITVENLLYGILVHSGNDAAYAMADNYGFERFIDLMNKKGKALSMNETRFNNPAGLDEFDQYTSPYDLSLAARALLQKPLLKKIVGTKEIVVSDIDFQYFHTLANVNKLLGEIQGIGGLKTGYTENAKENLISFYQKSGHQFIIVILRSDDRFEDTREAINWLNVNVDYLTLTQ
ncbi:hypothetical protein A2866_02785 [Candidatus Roizmanbacteria bacterium RIFCSPHIGHO2_01_FULL_39_8]|uniref:Peptidase S11 D-alanyl-D-alanine carboxypeptidase A N-terminal domain-containing protein n=3 Tax=Candidatus Roizmaniibacteriota TaxID=1752723 RepID=A0A1F7GRM9_9BACT|nr:MAG: hypothetical protein A2866_02785 [Candidatus Roizmanbacteria bacterium RIFCSPHIGHO2_01_FULL_39_8]OGK25475.1 MAG: hypothetical protein A3C28_01010 [Candidatus Roizmanbacteria bacterium RIFCSPHIGHO2_02_FULL_39_9]OGK38035.1 MAG: hypothetical protein A3F60_03345 [Candidatus Roizmanbacteria bacterium RIFCSPHIGHO2_12_FULL_39_8]